MKILLKEAFDASMPSNVRSWMNQYSGRVFRNSTARARADYFKDFDPSSAVFTDYSGESTKVLREWVKSKDIVLFAELEAEWGPNRTIAIYSDPTNSTNMLKLVGNGAENYKEKSFKWIVEHAVSLWGADFSSARTDKMGARQQSRKGLVSRDGDSAQPTEGRYSFDGADWKKDASGYWYDANRLSRELAKLHAEDVGYYPKKAADIFLNMANTYGDGVKKLAADPANIDLSTFGDGSFERITRDGQRLLHDAGSKMKQILESGERYAYTLDEFNAKNVEAGRDPIDEELYTRIREDKLERMQDNLTKIQECARELNALFK